VETSQSPANTLATGATLVTLIFTFGAVSGAHFNPADTLADASQGGMRWSDVSGIYNDTSRVRDARCVICTPYVRGAGASGVAARSWGRFPALQRIHRHLRFALRHLGLRAAAHEAVPFAVGLYITGAYWFTASTSFANPAVTFARAMTDTFAGISLSSVPLFIGGQIVGAIAAILFGRWLLAPMQERNMAPREGVKE